MDKIIIPSQVDWDLLKRFIICAESKSFVEAAKIASTSPDAIRKQMLRLETQMEEKLFLRHNKKVLTSLTPIGGLLRRKINILSNFLSSTSLIDKDYFSRNDLEKFEIITTQGLLNTYLSQAINYFIKKENSFIQFIIQTTKKPQIIRENQVVIRSDFLPQKKVNTCKLFTVEKSFYVSKKYIQKHGLPKDQPSLEKHSFIYSYGNLDLKGENDEIISIEPKVISSDLYFSLSMCLDGEGILCLPKTIGKSENLIEVLETQALPKDDIFIAYIEDFKTDSTLKRFIDHIKNYNFN